MKQFVSGYRAIALVATLLTLVGAFVIGTTILSRYDPTGTDTVDLPSSALAGGFETLAGVVIMPPTLLFAAVLRYNAYARMEKAWGVRPIVVIAAGVVEAVFIFLTFVILWGATEPVIYAGYLWVLNVFLGLVWFVLSGLFLAIIAVATKKRQAAAQVAE